MILTHYIIARRDLSLGDLVAQVAHAAGESFYALERTRIERVVADYDALVAQRLEPSIFNRRVAGLNPAQGSSLIPGNSVSERPEREDGCAIRPRGAEPIDIGSTIVVVLGARNEHRLLRLEKALIENAVAHVAIREVDGPHAGHLMAIGLVPALKESVASHLNEFHMLRECSDLP
jgi:hypothetical protein